MYQRNQRILSYGGLLSSFDIPWSKWVCIYLFSLKKQQQQQQQRDGTSLQKFTSIKLLSTWKLLLEIRTYLFIYTLNWKVYLSLPCNYLYWFLCLTDMYSTLFWAIIAFLYSCIYFLIDLFRITYYILLKTT